MSSDRDPTSAGAPGRLPPHHVRSSDLNPRGQFFWTLIITATVGLLALQRAMSPPPPTYFQQTSLGGLPASSLSAAPISVQPDDLTR